METLWYHNAGVNVEAARMAANSGVVDGVIFRLTHPRDERFYPALDGAMDFKAKNPKVRVTLGFDLWYRHELRLSQFYNDPVTIFRDNLRMTPCIPGVETCIDTESYNNLSKAVNHNWPQEVFNDLLSAIMEYPRFDYVTPAPSNKLAYPGVKLGDPLRSFPLLGKIPIEQKFYYTDLANPQKWLDANPLSVVALAVSSSGFPRHFTVADAMKVYPLRSRMLYPAVGQEVACARLL